MAPLLLGAFCCVKFGLSVLTILLAYGVLMCILRPSYGSFYGRLPLLLCDLCTNLLGNFTYNNRRYFAKNALKTHYCLTLKPFNLFYLIALAIALFSTIGENYDPSKDLGVFPICGKETVKVPPPWVYLLHIFERWGLDWGFCSASADCSPQGALWLFFPLTHPTPVLQTEIGSSPTN